MFLARRTPFSLASLPHTTDPDLWVTRTLVAEAVGGSGGLVQNQVMTLATAKKP